MKREKETVLELSNLLPRTKSAWFPKKVRWLMCGHGERPPSAGRLPSLRTRRYAEIADYNR